jgi:hypothetical protein
MTAASLITCPAGTPWCTGHENEVADDECVNHVGEHVLEVAPRGDAFGFDQPRSAAVAVCQYVGEPGDDPEVYPAWIELNSPDTSGCQDVNWFTAAEARALAGYLLAAADLLDP